MIAIRRFRRLKGWTQEEFANICGVAKSTVGMWEIGERKPDIITLKKIASIFGCTTDELLASINFNEEN
ncbi:MAG: helix-turn-helix transcriptional regulator [Oscillospiraceae bacterium]|nr:helix-turn-helix transcriptional regulator [Oscillospiraceae bacterium]